MKRARLHIQAAVMLAAIFVAIGAVRGQSTNSNSTILRLAPRAAQALTAPRPSGQDLFNNMISSAAAFDTDSPVEARAEFQPPVAPLGARVLYRLTVSALDESLKVPDKLPAPDGLELKVGGRAQTYEGAGNGKMRPQTTVIFHVTAPTNGVFKMPAFEVMAYGKPVKVPETTLTVVAAGAAPAHEPPRLVAEFPAEDIYVGETVRVPVLLPVPADGSVQTIYQARISGEFVFSEQASGTRQETIRLGGKSFLAFVQEVMFTPLREGPQDFVAQSQGIASRPIPGQANAFQSYNTLIDSDPVTLTIKPLPKEGQLPGFTGAIGNFQIDPPRLETNEARAGDPVTLAVTVHGDGDPAHLKLPRLPFLRDWQTFPPVAEGGANPFAAARNSANFVYTMIPLSERIKATPAIPFCYFDPKQKAYVDLTIPPVALTVQPGPAGAVAQSRAPDAPNAAGDDGAAREKEPVLTGLSERPGGRAGSLTPMQQRGWFLALQGLPALALGGLWLWDRRRRFLEKHPEVALKRQARRGLRRQIQLARRAAAARDAAGFVSGAANALREACAPHGAANPEALVCADVLRELPAPERQGPPGEVVRRFFAAADALRFGGPVKDGADLLALQPDVERVLEQLKARL